MKLLLIDNFDSFTYNLYQQLARLANTDIEIRRNNEISINQILDNNYDGIIISPGPSNPDNAGVCLDLVKEVKCPLLGVCLGQQIIAQAYGAKIVKAKLPMHGKRSVITHNQTRLFSGIPNYHQVARYHSLVIKPDSLTSEFQIDANCDGEIMAISNINQNLFAIQFHPESYLTEYGDLIISNFLNYVKN